MPSINFYLDKQDKKGQCPIYLMYRMEGKKFKASTKQKANPKYWNSTKQRLKPSYTEAEDINDELDKLEAKLKKAIRFLKHEEIDYDIHHVKQRFLEQERPDKQKKKIGLFEFFDLFVEKQKARNKRKTLKEYNTIINDLKEYETHYKEKLTFDKIDEDFLSKYLDYLYEEKGNVRNTVVKKISTLKTMLRNASRTKIGDTKEKVNTNMDFLDFKEEEVTTKKVTLTEEELLHLYHFDLSDNLRLERIRDKFCFACLTSMRFGDLNELKEEWITKTITKGNEDYYLEYKDQKTKTDISIPLSPLALRIVEKYRKLRTSTIQSRSGTLVFSKISPQKYNEYLKELGALAGLDQAVSIKKYYSNSDEPKEFIFKKHELLSSHAARRTYISLSIMRGAKPIAVKGIVGHKKLETTMKYATIKEDWKTKQMKDAWDGFGE